MFENIRKCLDRYEEVVKKAHSNSFDCELTKEEERILFYFPLHLAEEMMLDKQIDENRVAKIIFAVNELSNEIKVSVE